MTRKLFCYRQGWPDRPQAPNHANNTRRGTLGELNVDRNSPAIDRPAVK
ncbi:MULTISPECIES: hypothetical protein [unclassified Microcoleus]